MRGYDEKLGTLFCAGWTATLADLTLEVAREFRPRDAAIEKWRNHPKMPPTDAKLFPPNRGQSRKAMKAFGTRLHEEASSPSTSSSAWHCRRCLRR